MRMPIALAPHPNAWSKRSNCSDGAGIGMSPPRETSPQALIATPTSLMERVRHLFCADPEAVPHLAARLEGRRPLVVPLAAQVIPERVASRGARTRPRVPVAMGHEQ